MTKIKDCTITELVNYSNACSLIINKQIEGSDYYRTVPSNALSLEEVEKYREISERYKKYKNIENMILDEIAKRLEDLC